MTVTFDPAKDARNVAKHGISLQMASSLEWDTAMVWQDMRYGYGEPRFSALALLGERLYFVAFVAREDDGRRIVSLRKANAREVRDYVANA